MTVTKVLMDMKTFMFYSNAVESVNRSDEFSSLNFDTYECSDSSDRILLVRDKDTICIQPGNSGLYIHVSESFAVRALEL
ncbi:unnamed protein product, partial [Rotaria sp. Silwood1]